MIPSRFVIGPLLASMALIPAYSPASTIFTANFASGIPSSFTLINASESSLNSQIYTNIGSDMTVAWTAGQLPGGYGRAAFCPTHNIDADTPSEKWMILPELAIPQDVEGLVLRWEARSLHSHLRESYRVAVRKVGDVEWNTVFSCDAEDHYFTVRSVSLDSYRGCEIEIAFIGTGSRGFILAVDNIFVGVPVDNLTTFDNHSIHYAGAGDDNHINGTLSCFGASSPWTAVILKGFGAPVYQQLPVLECGESVEVSFDITPEPGQRYDYTISAADAQGNETLLCSDFLSCSWFPRTQVIDRCSGTWCNNCPMMELTTSRLSHLYGNQLVVIEAHINDRLSNLEYNSSYLSDQVYSIPNLIPNHNPSLIAYSVADNDNFSTSLSAETIAAISASATLTATGDIRIDSSVNWALPTDNTSGRYRVAYMLLGDYHRDSTNWLNQKSAAYNFRHEQYYYQPDRILSDMMFYDNVPIEGSVAYNGVPASLPANLAPEEEYHHSFTLEMPDDFLGYDFRALAMVIDSSTGYILNASLAQIETDAAVDIIPSLPADSPAKYYDLMGRPVMNPTSGFYIISRGGRNATVVKK